MSYDKTLTPKRVDHKGGILKLEAEPKYNAIVKIKKSDLATIKKLLSEIPHEIIVENFTLNQYHESKI